MMARSTSKSISKFLFYICLGAGLGIGSLAFADRDLELTCGKGGILQSITGMEREISQEIPLTGKGLLENCKYAQSCEDRLQKELNLTSNVSKALKALLYKLNYMSDISSQHRTTIALEEIDKIIHECNATIKSAAIVEKQKITLSYPLKGPNSQKNAQYDRNALTAIVEAAIRAGVDPYLAMAIVVMENPPTSQNMQSYKDYAANYGDIPVDQIAAFDIMGCHFNPNKKADPALAQEAQKYKVILKEQDRLDKELYKILKTPGMREIYSLLQDKKFQEERFSIKKTTLKMLEIDATANALKIKLTKEELDSLSSELDTTNKQLEVARQKTARNFSMIQKLHESIQSNENTKNALAKDWDMEKLTAIYCMAKPGCKQAEKQDAIPQIDFSTIETKPTTKQFCTNGLQIVTGAYLIFYSKYNDKGCCVSVLGDQSKGFENSTDIQNWLGAQFVKSRIQNCISSQSSISSCIQKFNGTGCFGCTEKMKNPCLNGVVMEDRPVYGARVADIMTNMLMKNREIQKMVQDISKRSRKPIKSSFCIGSGEGKVTVAATKFLEEQKKYLLEGADASYKSRFLENGRVSLREPSSEKDFSEYKAREEKRAQACSSLFTK